MKRLNIIGAGKLGQTLAHLFHSQQLFRVESVINRSLSSAQQAVDFIGAGQAAEELRQAETADIWLIATADGDIDSVAQALYSSEVFHGHEIVFHCSGSLASDILHSASHSPPIASIHPIHSFAKPENSVRSFHGSYCAYEGDKAALDILLPAFEKLGAQLLAVNGEKKPIYHAASVMACNYLVALMDASLSCFEQAGIDRQQAQQLLLPITHATLDNTLQGTPEQALTGPIARGDIDTVTAQLQQLKDLPSLDNIYRALGVQAVAIAKRQDSPNNLELLEKLLQENTNPV
ncbi:MAG: oxidoreductase [Cellvibrionaceae bacterium]|nr:oxidoreductase [Cellvibrionaceae bacterium]